MTSGVSRCGPLVIAFNFRGEEQVSGGGPPGPPAGPSPVPAHESRPVAWVLVGVHPGLGGPRHEIILLPESLIAPSATGCPSSTPLR